MKEKMILFVIGILVGAIISTGAFLVCTKTINSNDCSKNKMQMPGGPNMQQNGQNQNGQGPNRNQNGQPPEKPNNDNENNNQNNS